MEKAYEIKSLVEKFKARGLDLGEEVAKMVVEETFSWAEESAKLSENKYDDLVPFSLVKSEVLKLADKIDGQVG